MPFDPFRLACGTLAVVMLGACTAPAEEDDTSTTAASIVGGGSASETYSFMASLQDVSGHYCGGALVAPEWVVTAYHCIDRVDISKLTVRIGTTEHAGGGTLAKASKLVLPPQIGGWHISGVLYPSHDIGLVRLSAPVTNTPIKIAESSGGAGTPTRLIGWGSTCAVGTCIPDRLQELDTKVAPDLGCATVFLNPVNEICMGGFLENRGSCFGDSGGPSLVRANGQWQLTGVTSRNSAPYYVCAVSPSVYTDVVAWRDWIRSETGLNL